MQLEDIDLTAWIGRTETATDTVTPTPVRALTATLDHPAAPVPAGTPLPPLWHWLYFLPVHRAVASSDPTATPARGLPAAGRAAAPDVGRQPVRVPLPDPRRRRGRAHVDHRQRRRQGRPHRPAGLRHRAPRGPQQRRRRTRRWSSSTTSSTASRSRPATSSRRRSPRRAAASWQREIVPDDVLLFRYSALTFNGHRIHYDRRYVTEVEGYPGLIVHGPLIATLLMDLVRRNAARRRCRDVPVQGRAARPSTCTRSASTASPQATARRPPLGPGPRGLADDGRHRDASLTGSMRHATARRAHRRHAGTRDRRRRSRPASSPTSAPASSRSSVPASGDFARGYDARVRGLASHFVWTNRSKESLTLDVKHPDAAKVLERLVLDKADVVVQNLAPGAAARLGLGYDAAVRDEAGDHRLRHLRLRRRRPVPRQEGLRPADPERGGLPVGHRHARTSRARPARRSPTSPPACTPTPTSSPRCCSAAQTGQRPAHRRLDAGVAGRVDELPALLRLRRRPAAAANRRRARHHLPLRPVPDRRRRHGDAGPAERARVGQLLRRSCCSARSWPPTRASPATPGGWPSGTRCAQLIVDAFAASDRAAGAWSGWRRRRSPTPGSTPCTTCGSTRSWRPAAAGARSARRQARCPRCCRRAPGTSSRAWTRCPRSASTPMPILVELGYDAQEIARAARRRGRSEMAVPARPTCSCRATARNDSPRRWPAGPTRSCSTSRTRSPLTPRPTRATPSRLGRDGRRRATGPAPSCASTTPRRPEHAADLRLVAEAGVQAVMLPKAESAEQVAAVRAAVPACQVLALIESARGGRAGGRGGRGRRGDPAGLRHARLRARPRPGHRRRTGRAGLRGRPAGRRLPHRRACPRRSPASPPSSDDEARLLADLGVVAPARLRRQAVHPPGARSQPIHAALAPSARGPRRGRGACSRPMPRSTRSRPARRPHDRPPGRAAGRTAPWPARATEPPSPIGEPPCRPPSSTPRIFQGIFTTDEMRHVWSDENRTAEVPRHRSRAGQGAGRARHDPAGGRRRDRQPLPPRPDRHGQAARADRAHRLPDPRRGHPAQRALPRQARRVLPLGRHHAGHHRHRHRAADPRGAATWSTRADRDLRRLADAGQDAPRHPDDRPQQPAAGHPDDLRLQDGRAAVRDRAAPRAAGRSCASGCWWASSPAPRARWPRWRTGRWRPRPGCAPSSGSRSR